MIRVSRGPEPEALRLERRRRLSRAILDRGAGDPVDFSGYDVAKEQLVAALNYKCVFCEIQLHKEGSPVEHFRPKACVENDGEPRDESRYWWLAWTWENLLFACARCNTSYKRNRFPLAHGTAPLPERSFELEAERPLLIDPARIDPREHIRYRWSESRGRWVPVPVARSDMGPVTVEVLGLDEADLPTDHVADRVDPWVDRLAETIRQGDPERVQSHWNSMCRSLFAAKQPFHAVTWDALEAKVPERLRRQWGLDLPQLGKQEAASASRAFAPSDDPPLLSTLPEKLQLRVRALGEKAKEEKILSVLQDVLESPGPAEGWTDEVLAILLQREPGTIKAYRRKLKQPR